MQGETAQKVISYTRSNQNKLLSRNGCLNEQQPRRHLNLLLDCKKDLDGVEAVSKVMLANVNGLLLDYLLLLLCAIGTESLCITTTVQMSA